MSAYAEAYLNEVVENQGKLFDYFALTYPEMDTENFICTYMKSKTRQYIDKGQAYVCTIDASELWNYFQKTDCYRLQKGKALKGFLPDWIGEFYAYYQWKYDVPSCELVDKVPLSYLEKAYPGLHDLDLALAVEKVGKI